MSIHDLSLPVTDPLNYDAAFRRVIEDHLTFLIEHEDTRIIAIEDGSNIQFEGDFYSLLNHLKIPPDLHWIVMRMNGMKHQFEYGRDMVSVLIPSNSILSGIKQSHRHSRKIN